MNPLSYMCYIALNHSIIILLQGLNFIKKRKLTPILDNIFFLIILSLRCTTYCVYIYSNTEYRDFQQEDTLSFLNSVLNGINALFKKKLDGKIGKSCIYM